MSKRDRKIDLSGPGGLTHNPFAALRGRDSATDGPSDAVEDPAGAEGVTEGGVSEGGGTGALEGSHVVVRHERKGRGGKTVTVATWKSPSEPDADALTTLARALARSLGAGVRVEEGDLVVQGEMVDRVAVRLEEVLGARVVRGT